MNHALRIATVLVAFAAVGNCSAATIISGTATPKEAYISQKAPEATFNFEFAFSYYNNEKMPCGAAINFGDGKPQDLVTIPGGMPKMLLMHKYSVANTYNVSMSGFAHSGMPACLGSQGAQAKVATAIQVAVPSVLHTLEVPPSPIAPSPAMDLPVKLRSTGTLAECGYTAHLFMVGDGGPDSLAAEVASQNGITALPAESLVLHLGKIDSTGHYRLDVTGTKNCSGTVSAQFDVKRPKLLLASAAMTGLTASYSIQTRNLTLNATGNPPPQTGQACIMRVEVASDKGKKIRTSRLVLSKFPDQSVDRLDPSDFGLKDMPYGHYTVSARPMTEQEMLEVTSVPMPVCLGGLHTTGFDIAEPKLGDLGTPVIDHAELTVTTSGGPGSGQAPASAGPIVFTDRTHTSSVMLAVSTTHPENAKNGCGYTVLIDNGFKTIEVPTNSLESVDLYQKISIMMGWYGGDYKIRMHTTTKNVSPACLGNKELTLRVGEMGGTVVGMTATTQFQDTALSGSYAPQVLIPFPFGLFVNNQNTVYGTVTLKPRIAGNACFYKISLQAPGDVPKFTSTRMHTIEGGDDYTIEFYRGPNTAEEINKARAHFQNTAYSLIVKAVPNDQITNAVPCNGEYRNDNFHIPM